MERIFDLYSEGLDAAAGVVRPSSYPRGDEPEAVWERSIKAKALDAMRGLLPAASLSHVGIYASGQAYEQLVMRLLASPLPEARAFGEMALEELRKVIPAFVKRVDMPDRGGAWIDYLERAARARRRRRRALRPRRRAPERSRPSVRLLRVDGTEEDLLAALPVRGDATCRRRRCARRSRALDADERARAARGAGRRAREPPPQAGPRLRGAALPVRDRLRLRRASATSSATGC